jgi:excisionase family DNA binding protein
MTVGIGTPTGRAFKVRQVADGLNCTEAAVYRLIAAGDLKAFRVGRQIRVRESAIADFISRQEG